MNSLSAQLKSLVRANPVEIPSGLKMEQKAELIEDTRQNLEKQGLNHIDFEDTKRNGMPSSTNGSGK